MTTLFLASIGLSLCQPAGIDNGLAQAVHSQDFAAVDAAVQTLAAAGQPPADLDALQHDLTDPTPGVRQLAAYALSQLDPERAGQAVPALIEALQHPEPRVRARLALALAKMGPPAQAAIPNLIEQLKDEDPRARAGAARALGNLASETAAAVPALAALLKDPEAPVRVISAMALGQLGPRAKAAAPALRTAQRADPALEVRSAAAAALEDVDPPVALVLAALRDVDAQRRLWAVSRLIDDGVAARRALPQLAQMVHQDPNAGVRAGAALALGKVGPDAQSAAAELLQALQDSSARVRGTAALALGLLGPGVKGSGPPLAKALSDEDPSVADAAATALGNLGQAAESAAPILIGLLAAKDPQLRQRAVDVLARVGAGARPAQAALVAALNDDNAKVRRAACRALVSLGPQATAPIPVLIECLRYHQDEIDGGVRAWACLSLAEIGPGAADAQAPLFEALRDREAGVRSMAALALGRLGPAAVPALVGGLDHLQPEVRAGSAQALGIIGPGARRAVAALLHAARDEDAGVRLAAAAALGRVAAGLQAQQDAHDLPMLEDMARTLQEAKAPPPGSPPGEQWQAAQQQVRDAIAALQTLNRARLLDRLLHNPLLVSWAVIVGVFSTLLIVWSLLLWLRPLALLYLGEKLRPLPRLQVPIGFCSVELSARELLLLRFFEHRPRVLDAWTAHCRETYCRNFEAKRTVQERKVHVPLPVAVDGRQVPAPTARDFGAIFARTRGCLLICGADGAGKTSLACCLARWAMADDPTARLCDHVLLPVLIEHDLEASAANGSGHGALVEAVRGQVQALLGDDVTVSEELIGALLRRRRLLVIVDRLSASNDALAGALRPGHADFPAHALVVISRGEEPLEGVPRTVVQPQRIEGSHLLSFLDAYLSQCGQRQRLDDAACFEACRQLATLVGGREITPLFARFFAELLMTRSEGEAGLPRTVPDLMRAYVLQRNRAVPAAQRRSDAAVHADASTLAWECLRRTLRHEPVSLSSALAALGGADARERLVYLEQELRLVRTLGAEHDRVCFELEPLAEYLAALGMVARNGQDLKAWQKFVSEYPVGPDDPHAAAGFWQALRDCCQEALPRGAVLQLLAGPLPRAA